MMLKAGSAFAFPPSRLVHHIDREKGLSREKRWRSRSLGMRVKNYFLKLQQFFYQSYVIGTNLEEADAAGAKLLSRIINVARISAPARMHQGFLKNLQITGKPPLRSFMPFFVF